MWEGDEGEYDRDVTGAGWARIVFFGLEDAVIRSALAQTMRTYTELNRIFEYGRLRGRQQALATLSNSVRR